MSRTSVEDPLKVFRFVVEINGMAKAGFMECSGLERTSDVTEYREGGDNSTPRKSPGLSKFSDITLKRGQVMDEGQNDLYNWSQEVFDVESLGVDVRDFRRDVDIVVFERGGLEAIRWRVHNAFPSRFKTPDMNATSSDDAIEEMVLTYEGFQKVV